MNESAKMWGGRFAEETSPLMKRFNDSFSYDVALLDHDVRGSIAWVAALEKAGVLTGDEAADLTKALEQILAEGEVSEADLSAHEDVHSYVEAELGRRVGKLAAKLHTGRSRNDQVATDLRLWLRAANQSAAGLALDLAGALASLAAEEADTVMPGYTHLKQAEPISFGHWCLAYVEMIRRDADRFATALERADECPLGSAALAGTPLPIDREALAADLGFARASRNSLDAVSSRDAAIDFVYAATMLLGSLSRLAEDMIFFNSDEVGYVELPDALSTGSSRMPQKKNPDLLELVRGHAARAIGELTGLMTLMKGLPLSYNKDLQLDKEPLFRLGGVLDDALPALTALVGGLRLNRDRMHAAASSDLLLSTTLMDIIAERGVPFRTAHEIVSKRIGEALLAGKTLRELGPTDEVTASDLEALSVETALGRKGIIGGTSPEQVRQSARNAIRDLANMKTAITPDGSVGDPDEVA